MWYFPRIFWQTGYRVTSGSNIQASGNDEVLDYSSSKYWITRALPSQYYDTHTVHSSPTHCSIYTQLTQYIARCIHSWHNTLHTDCTHMTQYTAQIVYTRVDITVESRHVKFGIQIGSDWFPNVTNLGLFKISFSTFWLGAPKMYWKWS